MSKRFSDSAIWDDPWFQELPGNWKNFWRYICDKCDIAGFWKVNLRQAEFQIHEKFKWNEMETYMNKDKLRVAVLSPSLWLVVGFVEFQYGDITQSSHPFHKKIMNELSRYPLDTLSNRVLDRSKEKEEVKDKEKDITGLLRGKTCVLSGFDLFWQAYPRKMSKGQAEKAWKKLSANEQLTAKILQAVERAKTSNEWLKDSGQFIPYPASWLNAKGWENEIKTQEETDDDRFSFLNER